jgi:hypothetical protein
VHSKGDIWYDTEFINIFSFLVCHGSHTVQTTFAPKKSPHLVVIVFPQHSWSTSKINVMPGPLPDKMVLLLWERSHYAVMEVIMSSRMMNIYDGLNKSLSAWYPHAEYILKMLGIIKAPFKSPAVSFSLCQCQPPLSLVMGKMIGIFQLKSSLPNMMVIIVDQLHASRSLKCFIWRRWGRYGRNSRLGPTARLLWINTRSWLWSYRLISIFPRKWGFRTVSRLCTTSASVTHLSILTIKRFNSWLAVVILYTNHVFLNS